jgi:hypothetical protein
VDEKALLTEDSLGLNAYARVRTAGAFDVGGSPSLGDPVMLEETVRELGSASGDQRPVLATNIAGAQRFGESATVRSPAGEQVWQAEFGAQPSPLGVVIATVAGDDLIVARSVWYAPLRGRGATERWQRDVNGSWRLAQTLHTWSL